MKSILLCFALCSSSFAQSHLTWADYAGSPDAAQYSALKQIHRGNVGKLKIAWIYPTEDTNRYSFNPVVVDSVIFVLARNNAVVALNAVTGQEIWRHEADPDTKIITNRGINYWESKDRSDRRLLFAHMLQAIDARTGKAIPTFGNAGRVNLKEGLGRDPQTIALVQSTTPGRVFEDLLILGSATNQGWGSAPGDVRAFDVRSGAVRWSFHTIPHEGEFGYDTWPKDAWKSVGGANAWSEMTLDEKRGIVYIPTASPKYNFYGADRKGANLFGDCLLALDARTGKRLWHFQMVHHDIWDYDDATAPKLLTVQHDGKPVDIVAQVSKQAFVWVFNRVKKRGRHNPFPWSLRPLRARSSPPTIWALTSRTPPNARVSKTKSKAPAMRECSRRPACAIPYRCPATTAARTGAARRSIPPMELSMSSRKICPAC
jgi:quinoprotein glucose dehydrogenase